MHSNSLRTLSNHHLHERLRALSIEERKLTLEILHHLREVERRRLYAERGHGSLYEYATKELSYSEASAQRRISAMRALKELPELEEKIESGELKLTQISQVQSFLRAEKTAGKPYSIEAKRELFQSTIGCSSRETERLLAEKNPAHAQREKVQAISEDLTKVTLTLDRELLEKLERLRDRFAHRLPVGAGLKEVIAFLASSTLEKEEKELAKAAKGTTKNSPEKSPEKTESTPAPEVTVRHSKSRPSRMIPADLRRIVWNRDRGACTFVSPSTGKRCDSRHRLEIDHIHPYALGGSSRDVRNLRLLCFAHNQLEAQRRFGERGRG